MERRNFLTLLAALPFAPLKALSSRPSLEKHFTRSGYPPWRMKNLFSTGGYPPKPYSSLQEFDRLMNEIFPSAEGLVSPTEGDF